jgi:HSP20 family protein
MKKKQRIKNDWLEMVGELLIDVYETPKDIIVEAPVAGVKPEDLEIKIEDDTLKIKGKRQRTQKIKKPNYLLQECYWGEFFKQVVLPSEINKSKIEANIKDGVLVIKLPKKKTGPREKKIEIKA